MPVDVITWLERRRRQGADVAHTAATLAGHTGTLAAAMDELAGAYARTSHAVEAVLGVHQPDRDERCREDRQPWPCRSVRATALALRGVTPPDRNGPDRSGEDGPTQPIPPVPPVR